MSELWDNPMIPIEDRLEIAAGAVTYWKGAHIIKLDEVEKLQRENEELKEGLELSRRESAELKAHINELRSMLQLVVGMHNAPSDCYSTGPYFGDYRDALCPSCAALGLLEQTPAQSLHDFCAKCTKR